MTHPNLIQTERRPVEYVKNGMLHRDHGNWQERNFHGFRQTRYTGEPWRFYICGFNEPHSCFNRTPHYVGNVQMFDQTKTACQMDDNNRVKINGKWYDHSKWDH